MFQNKTTKTMRHLNYERGVMQLMNMPTQLKENNN
jgi:hypothetical protein